MPPSNATKELHLWSPRKTMESKLQEANKESLISEVRESLTMPAIVHNISSPSPERGTVEAERQYATTANTTANSRQHQDVQVSRKSSDVDSVYSEKSTNSTSSLFSRILGRRKSQSAGDDQSVSSAFSNYSWWGKKKSEKKKKRPFRTFRWRKKGKKKGRTTNDQLVADFFDVQSIASEPDFVGTNKLKKATMVDHGHQLETRSVVSQRSERSTGFTSFLFRKLNQNDEVDGIDDPVDMIETGEMDFDEEITLGSGLENISLVDNNSVDEEESSVDTGHNDKQTATKPPENESFLQRILQKRAQKKHNSHLLQAIGGSSQMDLPDTTLPPVMADQAPADKRRTLDNNRISSSKSLGAVPVDTREIAIHSSSPGSEGCSMNRWDSDRSLDAPKRPKRTLAEPKAPEHAPSSPPESRPAQPTSQSMRNLTSKPMAEESVAGGNGDDYDDDDSVLSLLSGLLATWSSERETAESEALSHRHCIVRSNEEQPKSILKTSKRYIGEESKEEEARPKHTVIFDKIEIREYERIVGDNPSCSKGPPVSIGWAYLEATKYAVNDYENLIKPPCRTKKEFHLAAETRTQLLTTEWECSQEDIQKARREATYIQYCRAKTSFSGSRAAAKEAAFLRKANDQSKEQSPLAKKEFAMAPQALNETAPRPAVRAPEIPVSGLEPRAHIPPREFAPGPLSPRPGPKQPPPSILSPEERFLPTGRPRASEQVVLMPPEQAPAKKVPPAALKQSPPPQPQDVGLFEV